jgi:hypothetical protein|tara:strand:- start:6372 stop:6770 length:399 start_codon:yes stop_codon:yes gene_type:complete
MSHFSKIQTSLKDLDLLKKSLNDLSIHWEPELNRIRGYRDQTTFANIVIKQRNNYDIGFSWNGFEYQLVADIQFWQQPWSIELFLDRVSQRYAYNSIVESTSNQGFQTVNETVQEDGSIKLTLQKWNSNLVN